MSLGVINSEEKEEVRSDDGYSITSPFTLAQCIVTQNWGCIIAQMCTDDVLATAWRPLYLPCNVWYTINPSPSG